MLPVYTLKLHSSNLWLRTPSRGMYRHCCLARCSIKAFWSFISFDLRRGYTEHARAKGNRDPRPSICIRKLDAAVLNKFAVYTSAPHLTFMSPFYAFITLDTPDSANRVRSPLSASSRNIERPAKVKHILRSVSATSLFTI